MQLDPQPMGSISQRNRMLMLVVGIGIAAGLQAGLYHWVVWNSWLAPVIFICGALASSGVTYAMWRWVLPLLAHRVFAVQVSLETLVTLAVFAALSVTTVIVTGQVLQVIAPHLVIENEELRRQSAQLYVALPIIPTTLMALISYHLVYVRMHALQSQAERLRELAATAQLTALRSQLNPHFLFNCLNSIAQLIHTDPDQAERNIERLANILRYVLRSHDRDFVPLADELNVTEAYLSIEQARFEDRLTIDEDVAPEALTQMVPNLVLQPLVENAVKHGLSSKLGPGTVSISARIDDRTLHLAVHDDGIGMDAATLSTAFERGVGLRNLKERLHHLYGLTDGPAIVSTPGGGTTVEVVLPLAPEAAA